MARTNGHPETVTSVTIGALGYRARCAEAGCGNLAQWVSDMPTLAVGRSTKQSLYAHGRERITRDRAAGSRFTMIARLRNSLPLRTALAGSGAHLRTWRAWRRSWSVTRREIWPYLSMKMLRRITKISTAVAVVLAFAAAISSCATTEPSWRKPPGIAQGSFESSLDPGAFAGAPSGNVDILNTAGSIAVYAGIFHDVKVTAKVKAIDYAAEAITAAERVKRIEEHPPLVRKGEWIRVGYFDDKELVRSVTIDYIIYVPEQAQVRAQTGSGAVTITSSVGISSAEVTAYIGDVKLANIGTVRVATGSGNISLDSITGDVQASSIGGSIEETTSFGCAKRDGKIVRFGFDRGGGTWTSDGQYQKSVVYAGSGSISLKGVCGGVIADSGEGAINVEGTPASPWHLKSHSGNIETRVPSSNSFEVTAESNMGRLQTDYPLLRDHYGRYLVGKVGRGGNKVEISTFSGNIAIESEPEPSPPPM
jgi:hypothetical protein